MSVDLAHTARLLVGDFLTTVRAPMLSPALSASGHHGSGAIGGWLPNGSSRLVRARNNPWLA